MDKLEMVEYFNSVCMYVKAKFWALDKLNNIKPPANLDDITLFSYFYLSNLLGVIDYIKDKKEKQEKDSVKRFESKIGIELNKCKGDPNPSTLAKLDNYKYVRELRNAVVHRGLGIADVGHVVEGIVRTCLPQSISNRNSKEHIKCSFTYFFELANYCDSIVDKIIYEEIDKLNLFEYHLHEFSPQERKEFIYNSPHVPEWVKSMSCQLDEDQVRSIAVGRVNNLKSLLRRL